MAAAIAAVDAAMELLPPEDEVKFTRLAEATSGGYGGGGGGGGDAVEPPYHGTKVGRTSAGLWPTVGASFDPARG